MEEPIRAKEGCARVRLDVVPIGQRRPFSSIDRCPLEIPRLVAPLVAPVRPAQGEKGPPATRDRIAPRRGMEQLDLLGQSRGSARRGAVTTPERHATALNAESIARRVTLGARHARLVAKDATRRRTEALPGSDRLVATTAMTSTPAALETTRHDARGPRVPAAMVAPHDRLGPTIVMTATRARIVQFDSAHARRGHRGATATHDLRERARTLRMDAPVPNDVTTATRVIAVRVSRLEARGPTLEMAPAMPVRVARRVVGAIDVPVT